MKKTIILAVIFSFSLGYICAEYKDNDFRYLLQKREVVSHQEFLAKNKNKPLNQQEFYFRKSLFNSTPMTLSKIEESILDHANRRVIYNWFYVDTSVHVATLGALHAIQQKGTGSEASRKSVEHILKSHSLHLYSPFFKDKIRHFSLVDAHLIALTGKRYFINTLLDRVSDANTVVIKEPEVQK